LSDIMLETETNADKRDQLETIHNSGRSLLHLIEELLDFSRIEAGRVILEKRDYGIHEAVDPVLDLLKVTARQKSLELTCEIDASTNGPLYGDPEKLRQVLLNLVGNAVKFTDKGSISLKINCPDDQTLRIIIEDTGPGIPDDQREAIFEPFIRAKGQLHKEGSGLGLTIVRGFVDAMGGRVSAENTPLGAKFTLELPTKAI